MNAQRLAKIEKDIETIKARISKIGIVRPGSLTQQYKDPKTKKDRRCWEPKDGIQDNNTAFFQGDIGAHGVHLLFLADSDNARQTVPVDEIVFSQRQVFLTGQRDGAVGEQYGRGFEKPLVSTVSDAPF